MQNIMDTPVLLIAGPQLQDPNFRKSVILLLSHDDKGAFGFVINQLAPFALQGLVKPFGTKRIPDHIGSWIGGPVERERGIILHNRQVSPSDQQMGLHPIYLSDRAQSIEALVDFEEEYLAGAQKSSAIHSFRFLIGNAGWGPGQLLKEIELGAWFLLPFDEKLAFCTPCDLMWSAAMSDLNIHEEVYLVSSNQTLQ